MDSFFSSALFHDVQMSGLYEDSKTFADAIALADYDVIISAYERQKVTEDFDLKVFVVKYFQLPDYHESEFQTKPNNTPYKHIQELWNILSRSPDDQEKSSKIALPHSYVVPGGRFREIYYWDSYFTMLGLSVSGRQDLVQGMLDNFAYLIDKIGFIPNGSRTYFKGRSQPPFFSLMVSLFAEKNGREIIPQYLPYIEKEYNFWMDDNNRRLIKIGSHLVNRYFDNFNEPRPESYREDYELFQKSGNENLYTNLRAACESGWDFSSRWLSDKNDLASIECADLIPVDLNCLLYHSEITLSKGYSQSGNLDLSKHYLHKSQNRKEAIEELHWNETQQIYLDYNYQKESYTSTPSLAMVFPLFFEISRQEQVDTIADCLKEKFLKKGGLVTTLDNTGQQWDAPNGWPCLQWMAVIGLSNYGHNTLAEEIAQRWTLMNEIIFRRTGKFVEKYNVENYDNLGGGGEYPLQDGFGWTNGVYLAMKKFLEDKL